MISALRERAYRRLKMRPRPVGTGESPCLGRGIVENSFQQIAVTGESFLRTSSKLAGRLVCLIGIVALAACSALDRSKQSNAPMLVIPDFPTAEEQYQFAFRYQGTQILSMDRDKRSVQFAKIVQCYEKVVQNFPSDVKHTPLARLAIADTLSKQGQFPQATAHYEAIMRDYPSNEYVQARATFSIGRIHDRTGNHQLAKDTYRQIMDRYGNSRSRAVHDVVKRASTLYHMVQEQPAATR
jgi:tetratricopeptide (TPR) repeat protein